MSLRTRVATTVVAMAVASGSLAIFSDDFQRLLSRWEGDGQNVVYADKLAGGLPTVCRGLTKYTVDDEIVVGDYWSPERCLEVEKMVARVGQVALADCLDIEINQPIFDALSDHAHNLGVPSTCASRAVALINAGEYERGCDALAHKPDGSPAWSYVGKTFYRGLYNRRLAERELCLRGAAELRAARKEA